MLSTTDIPIADASSRTPQGVSALLSRFGTKWTNSVAINDLYFADAAPALRAGGKQGDAAPFSIGAGDGDPSAFQRINSKQFQAATVPEPLSEQGWQIVDEFNRAFAHQPAGGYIAPARTSPRRPTAAADPPGTRRDTARRTASCGASRRQRRPCQVPSRSFSAGGSMPFGGIDVVVEDLAGADEQVDLFVQPLEASSQGGQELGAGFEVGSRAGDAGLKKPDLLGRQSGFAGCCWR
ncbi:hypothetical protein QFZ76_009056 [Streptomyces sp. V4I2]|nr:hypothetical protein [Streptomyces sp. V4I2]